MTKVDSIILKYPSIKPTVEVGDTARIYVLNINYRQIICLFYWIHWCFYEEDHHDPSDIYNLKADF